MPALVDSVTRMRDAAEARMVDQCRLLADPDRTQDDDYDELTLELTPPPEDPQQVWPAAPAVSGPCLVNYRNLGRSEDDAGSQLEYLIALPYDVPLPLAGQWVEIVAAALLPGVSGSTLTISQVERGSLAPYVRLRAVLVTQRERAPGG